MLAWSLSLNLWERVTTEGRAARRMVRHDVNGIYICRRQVPSLTVDES